MKKIRNWILNNRVYWIFITLQVIMFNKGISQNITELNEIAEKAFLLNMNIRQVENENIYDSIIKCKDFNFSQMKPSNAINYSSSVEYEVYYLGESIAKIVRKENSSNFPYNYTLYADYQQDFIFLFGVDFANDAFDGIICVKRDTNLIYYVQASNPVHIDKGRPITKICYIMRLDSMLNPVIKFCFDKYKVLYYSDIIRGDDDVVFEELCLLTTYEYQPIDKIHSFETLETFGKYLKNEYTLGTVYPDIPYQHIPLWYYGNYEYK